MKFGILFGLVIVPCIILLFGVFSFYYLKAKEDKRESKEVTTNGGME